MLVTWQFINIAVIFDGSQQLHYIWGTAVIDASISSLGCEIGVSSSIQQYLYYLFPIVIYILPNNTLQLITSEFIIHLANISIYWGGYLCLPCLKASQMERGFSVAIKSYIEIIKQLILRRRRIMNCKYIY